MHTTKGRNHSKNTPTGRPARLASLALTAVTALALLFLVSASAGYHEVNLVLGLFTTVAAVLTAATKVWTYTLIIAAVIVLKTRQVRRAR